MRDPVSQSPDLPDRVMFSFDGNGNGAAFTGDAEAVPETGFRWLHLRRDAPENAGHLAGHLSALHIGPFVHDALIADETRPRCTIHGDGALINLRGVNLNPGAEPEDMISVRLWVQEHSIVGVWIRPLFAVSDLVAAIERGQSPVSPGDFVAKLALRLADRAEPSVAALNETIDTLEEQVLNPAATLSREVLANVRRQAIILRRYMIPQRDALTTLEIEDLTWLLDADRSRLREAAERIYRLGEELDAIRDRAQIVHDQIMDRRAEGMNQRMLVLSIVSAIFLPLGLLTGLLGINVGGVPGMDWPLAFWVVTGLLVVLGGGLTLLFRKLGLFR